MLRPVMKWVPIDNCETCKYYNFITYITLAYVCTQHVKLDNGTLVGKISNSHFGSDS